MIFFLQSLRFFFYGFSISVPEPENVSMERWHMAVYDSLANTAEWNSWQWMQAGYETAKLGFPTDSAKILRQTGLLWETFGIPVQWVQNKNGWEVPLVPVEEQLYGVSFYRVNGSRFYDFVQSHFQNLATTSVTYLGDFADNLKPIRLLEQSPVTIPAYQNKVFTFSIDGQDFIVNVPVDTRRLQFFSSLPVIEFGYALNYRFTLQDRRTWLAELARQFKESGLTNHEIAGALRQFIVQVFPYQEDPHLYGREHLSYPEEIFLGEGSDCEDRSILLALLIDELTGMKTFLADFPDHVSVLVPAPAGWEGDVYLVDDRPFVYLDPTYFDAPFGAVPDLVKGLVPDAIERKEYQANGE